MAYWESAPDAALASFVEAVCFSTDEDGRAAPPIRVIPDGRVDLLVSIGPHTAPSVRVFGTKTRSLWVSDTGPVENVALRLRPGAASALLGVEADALTDATVDALELIGRDLEGCFAAPDLAARADELQRVLRARAGEAERRLEPRVLAAARCMLERDGRVRVPELARALGWSERQLERAFRRHVGVSPKTFARVARFGSAWQALARGGTAVEVALARGYFDQPHLVRDFQAFAGAAPSRIFPSRRQPTGRSFEA